MVHAQTALWRTHVLLEALGQTVEWSQCRSCDDCRGLAVRSEAVAAGVMTDHRRIRWTSWRRPTLHWRRSRCSVPSPWPPVVTAYVAWPALRSSASLRKRQALIAYLRDHLTGSDVALRVVHRLGSTHRGTEDGTLFRRLYRAFEEDRAVVRTLLTQLGASGRSIKRAAGYASGTVLSVTAGGEPGDSRCCGRSKPWLSGSKASDACGAHCRTSAPSHGPFRA